MAAAIGSGTAAAEFPEKPVNLVVAFPPGGATDALARVYAEVVEKHLGQRVIVQNLPGGGGLTGTIEFMNKPAEGYWVIANPDPTYLVQILQGRAPYAADDFATLATWSLEPAALATPLKSDLDTVEKLVSWAKENPKALTVGVGNPVNHHAFALKKFVNQADVDVTRVVFQGGAPAMTALLGGHIGALFGNRSDIVRNKDQVHVLAVAGPERDPLLPDVPTFKELGYDVVEQMHRFVAVNAEVPEDRRQKLQSAFEAALNDPEFVEKMKAAGGQVPEMTAEETEAYLDERVEELEELVKE
jgi:tripartite-type tricarboxylate transporter receptor subunit TctC